MSKLIVTALVISFYPFISTAQDLDTEIGEYIRFFNLRTPKFIPTKDQNKFNFGKKLFSDNQLSLSNNISCKSCHNVNFGSSDALPFSIGTGGSGEGSSRIQLNAGITPRSSPHLFNKGHESVRTMFWDGRVRLDRQTNTYITPEPGLNGEAPKLRYITDVIENVMAMQAIFPMINPTEMLGNQLSTMSAENIWKEIAARVLKDPSYSLFIKERKNFNIAHIANALSYFQTRKFQVNDTPYDRYINGDKQALTPVEKKGAMLYLDKARCVRCHNGPILSNNAFQGVATPQIGPGVTQDGDDLGLFHTLADKRAKYLFKTQPLRNIALTAPYMHNGAFVDLAEVVTHYNSPKESLDTYSMNSVLRTFSKNYKNPINFQFNFERNERIKASLAPFIRTPLNLSKEEQSQLICFLKKSLTEYKYHSILNLVECNI